MPTAFSINVRVAYCVEIEAPDPEDDVWPFGFGIDWIKTLDHIERFAELYGNEDERIHEIYPILVKRSYEVEIQDDAIRELMERTNRFRNITSKVLDKICGCDDHGLKFSCIGYANDVVEKLILIHDIQFQASWTKSKCAELVQVNLVPLSLPSVEPTVGRLMAHVLSVLYMKAVDEPGWKMVTDYHHERF